MEAEDSGHDVSPRSVVAALVGFGLGLFGVYWDDAWHTDRGRDELLSAPHLVLYAGVALAVAVVLGWVWSRRELGWRRLGSGPMGIGVLGAAVTLASAPIDEWWHTAFGRDAVLWSPPHLVAVTGTVALGSGVAMVGGRSLSAVGRPTEAALLAAAGAGVLGAWQVLVLEYDTDVAQFSPLWYLPVLAVAVAAGSATVHAAIGHRVRWPAGRAGAGYTLAIVVVIVVLAAMGFSRPIVPVVVPALIVADLSRRRPWSLPVCSAAIVAALFVVYVPYLEWVDGGVAPSTSQAVFGAVIATFAVAVTLVLFEPAGRTILRLRPTTAAVVIVMALAIPIVGIGQRPAAAHDPGQGPAVADITLTAAVTGDHVELTGAVGGAVTGLEPVRVVARRAGRLLTGPLTGDETGWSGSIDLDQDGRWFLYVEAGHGSELVEAWLPVTVGSRQVTTRRTVLYVSSLDGGTTTTQLIAGGILVLTSLGIAVRVAAIVRSAKPPTKRAVPENPQP